jgi:hypothetical protein
MADTVPRFQARKQVAAAVPRQSVDPVIHREPGRARARHEQAIDRAVGMHNYWKAGFLDDLSDAAIDVLRSDELLPPEPEHQADGVRPGPCAGAC